MLYVTNTDAAAPAGPARRRAARSPKPPWQSRLWLSLLCLFVGSLISALLPSLPAELLDLATRAIVDEVVRYVAPLPLAAALGLNWFDRKQSATAHLTAGELARVRELGDRAAQAERKRAERGFIDLQALGGVLGFGLVLLCAVLAMSLPGCVRREEVCDVELHDHPTKPDPAGRIDIKCTNRHEVIDTPNLRAADRRRCK